MNTIEDASIQRLGELIKDIDVAMLTTVLPDGTLRSRPMATQMSGFEGELWFFTDERAPKVHEVEADQRVNVSYADPRSDRYVSVSGTARLVHDPARTKDFWSPAYKAWFPRGLEDPHLALLRVAVDTAEYWDVSSGTMTPVEGWSGKSGDADQPPAHAKIDFHEHRVST